MNNNFMDFAQLMSLYVGVLNLLENREQSAHNDVSAANDKQAAYMLKELTAKFEEQNKILNQILELVKKQAQ